MGIVAVKVVELDPPLVQSRAKVDLRHRQLVLVREQDALSRFAIRWFHKSAPAMETL
jgi:hypothetical protein